MSTLVPLNRATAEVPDFGFNSLFIGHSFFIPVAQGLGDFVGAAGIAGHSQKVVFSGGATGAPLPLWNNASKSAEIKSYLDSGEVELFGMTYHPSHPTTEGYENWIDYALEKNPTTRFFVGLPWNFNPGAVNAQAYASYWEEAHAGEWHDFLDSLRALYPGVEIYCIPYGQSASELRFLLEDDNLPGIDKLSGRAATSIYSDSFGHAGNFLRNLSRAVWLNAIYDVDLSLFPYATNDFVDLNTIAKSIMDEHDPANNAAYHEDADGDRIGDSLDNCPLIPNPDQLDTLGNGRGDACEGLPPGC